MPRALKVFRTHLGFFDTVVAVPSRAAALRAWGLSSDEFRTGFADETKDPEAVRAAMEKPGTVLYRVFGSGGAFSDRRSVPKGMKPPAAIEESQPKRQTKATRERAKALAKAEKKAAEKARAMTAAEEQKARAQKRKDAATEARRRAREEKARKKEAEAERRKAAQHKRAEALLEKKLKAISEKEEALRRAREEVEAEFSKLRER